MRWKGALWALPIVLLAQSAAFARMHADSPPTIQSFAFIAVYIASMWWLFKKHYGAGRFALAFGVGTVTSAIVLGEYVDALLHPIFNVPAKAPLPLAVMVPCACLVSAFVQAAAAPWAGQLAGNRPIRVADAVRVPWFLVPVIVPGAYILLKVWLFS